MSGSVTRRIAVVALFAMLTHVYGSSASAASWSYNGFLFGLVIVANYFSRSSDGLDSEQESKFGAASGPRAVPIAYGAVYGQANFNATLEPGEPTEGGKMQKTVWYKLPVTQNQRVVIHTFGSDFDTVLAVYWGESLTTLRRVTGNDNTAVPGMGRQQSLVQFNAQADREYHVQVGSKTGEEGNVYANVFVLPPPGGLSALLAEVGTTPWQGRDYICFAANAAPACAAAKFILHNSTSQTLTVTPSHDLGAGVVSPQPFTLAPGAVQTAQFTFNANFNTATTRTLAGLFKFTARAGQTIVNRTQTRALIIVKRDPTPDVLRAEVSPILRAGLINQGFDFDVKLTNTGTTTARGCHFRSELFSRIQAAWRELPADDVVAGEMRQNDPANIAPGASRNFRVTVASREYRRADADLPFAPAVIDCANTSPVPVDMRNKFDFTAYGVYSPAKLHTETLAPPGEVLKVPASSTAVFRVSAVNKSAPATLQAQPRYVKPFDENEANKQFTMTICQMNTANGPCLAPPAASVNYEAPRNVTKYFKVFVSAPAVNPGFAPGKRRAMLIFFHVAPTVGFEDFAPVAAESVAVRMTAP